MRKASILVAEDDPISASIIQKLLIQDGYDVTLANNGQEALEKYKQEPSDIVIADMNMPIMDGRELVHQLLAMEDHPICIIETADSDSNTIIDMMKIGVQDYLIKPIRKEDLLFRIAKAVEIVNLKNTKHALEKERQMRLEKQLDWNIMKERIAARSYDRFDKTLFSSLKASFNQGAGIGALVSLLSLLKKQVKAADGYYHVKADMMDMVFLNADIAQRALNSITEISNMLDMEFEKHKISVQQFYEGLFELQNEMKEKAAIKNHHIKFNDANYSNVDKSLLLHNDYVLQAFRELIINALKFSVPGSDIYVFTNCGTERFFVSIMNQPVENITGTTEIPKDYEKLIFEPFFRMVKYVSEEYETLDFGLGLTMVEKIIRKNLGRIILSTVRDNSNLEGGVGNTKVNFEVDFPLVD